MESRENSWYILKGIEETLDGLILSRTLYVEGNVVLLEEVRESFNEWLGKSVKKLDSGTFGQVNKEYTIESIKTCKHCGKEHKKGCCENYNRTKRSTKKIVRNLEIMKDDIPERIEEL